MHGDRCLNKGIFRGMMLDHLIVNRLPDVKTPQIPPHDRDHKALNKEFQFGIPSDDRNNLSYGGQLLIHSLVAL